jgi:hypothetical protein
MPPSAAVRQFTIQYKTFLKRIARQALADALANHSDPTVQRAQVALGYSYEDFSIPAIIVGFSEHTMPNAGVGHYEWLPSENDPSIFIKYQHRLYKGDLTFTIYAQTTTDLDVMSDALVEVFVSDEVSAPGLAWINRFYNENAALSPPGVSHFPTVNTDLITPMGDQAVPPPWRPEDALIYQTGYSLSVFGEFYSYVSQDPVSAGPIVEVDVYSWPSEDGVTPLDPTLPEPPVLPSEYEEYTGFPAGSKTVPTG